MKPIFVHTCDSGIEEREIFVADLFMPLAAAAEGKTMYIYFFYKKSSSKGFFHIFLLLKLNAFWQQKVNGDHRETEKQAILCMTERKLTQHTAVQTTYVFKFLSLLVYRVTTSHHHLHVHTLLPLLFCYSDKPYHHHHHRCNSLSPFLFSTFLTVIVSKNFSTRSNRVLLRVCVCMREREQTT